PRAPEPALIYPTPRFRLIFLRTWRLRGRLERSRKPVGGLPRGIGHRNQRSTLATAVRFRQLLPYARALCSTPLEPTRPHSRIRGAARRSVQGRTLLVLTFWATTKNSPTTNHDGCCTERIG